MTQPQEQQITVQKFCYRIEPADILVDVLGPTKPGGTDDCGIRIPVECPDASKEESQ
jgi:hypothetical protein